MDSAAFILRAEPFHQLEAWLAPYRDLWAASTDLGLPSTNNKSVVALKNWRNGYEPQ
jgi:hypothetical protein